MSGFWHWYSEVADIPVKQDDGTWVDLETGIPYVPEPAQRPARRPLRESTREARAVAKAFGGRALKGTRRQKDWAEGLRARVLPAVTAEQAAILVHLEGTQHASFWIDTRAYSPGQIGAAAERLAAVLREHNRLIRAADAAVSCDAQGFITDWGEHPALMAQARVLAQRLAAAFGGDLQALD